MTKFRQPSVSGQLSRRVHDLLTRRTSFQNLAPRRSFVIDGTGFGS